MFKMVERVEDGLIWLKMGEGGLKRLSWFRVVEDGLRLLKMS